MIDLGSILSGELKGIKANIYFDVGCNLNKIYKLDLFTKIWYI